MFQRIRAKLESLAYNFTMAARHLARQGVELSETKIGNFLTNLSPERANQLARREQERLPESGHWFTIEERALVNVLAFLIVPSDETSPGAEHLEILGLSVVERLDGLVACSPDRQILYALGLLALDQLAREKCSSKFVNLPFDRQVKLLEFIDQLKLEWSKSTSLTGKIKRKVSIFYYKWTGLFAAVNLFPRLIQDVFQIFYTDQVSWIWLGYDGPPMPQGYPDLINRRSQVERPVPKG